ncbi:MAG TPA: 4-vinyl reductase [Myxococcota bacterium]|jgi:predicted hydrocarbon binding protein|nr:4-vinyl reductase [Myxococcota bacterium]
MVGLLERMRRDAARGALVLDGTRYLVIRPETVVTFQKRVEAVLGAARGGDVVAEGGFEGGRLSTHRFLAAGFDARGAAEAMSVMAPEIGWGRFEITGYDPAARRLEVVVYGSPFAEAYGPSAGACVCHLIRGVVHGMAAASFPGGEGLAARETECTAAGAPACRFVVEPRRALGHWALPD